MRAVHFGGGNIGRGFIGEVLNENGYEVIFIDVDQTLIDRLNQYHSYKIKYYGEDVTEKLISNVSGINSKSNPEAVANAILECDIITCSVGFNNLKYIAKNIAEGIVLRMQHQIIAPIDIIACENIVHGSEHLKAEVYNFLDNTTKTYADKYIGFPNASVDRIVPNLIHKDRIDVSVEQFKEWIVETKDSKTHEIRKLNNVNYVSNILPYTERKLLTVNSGHASIAYLGHLMGYDDVVTALVDPVIEANTHEVLNETGTYLNHVWGLDKKEHELYIDQLLKRFRNENINDKLNRVARNPIQKLGPNERFILPLNVLRKSDLPHGGLIRTIASAFLFDYDEDAQSKTLQERLKKENLEDVIKDITKIEDEKLIEEITAEIIRFKNTQHLHE